MTLAPDTHQRVALIYRNNIRERFANILSLLKNMEALSQLAYHPVLMVPQRGWKRQQAYEYLREACHYYQAQVEPAAVSLVPSSLKFYGRSFGLLAALLSRRRNYPLVWSHDIFGAYMATLLGCTTVWEHHTGLTPKSQRLLKAMLPRPNFKGVISISHQHRAFLEQQGIPSEKIHVAHSGIEEALLRPPPSPPAPSAPYTIVYAGSFYAGRGIETIIAAAQALPDCRFICIGGTAEQIEEYQTRYPDCQNVQLLANMQRDRLFTYLRSAHLLLAPYTKESQSGSGENIANFQSPLKLMEYMAFGKPIVTSRVGAIPEIITDEHNGLLVGADCPEAYVAAIQRIQNDPTLATQLGHNARQAAAHYTWNKRVAGIIHFSLN